MFAFDAPTLSPLSALALVWSCLTAVSPAQEPSYAPQPSDDRHQVAFEGKIGDKTAVRAVINVTPSEDGNSSLQGTYHYLSQGKVIYLLGSLEGGRASLDESAHHYLDPVTGRFEGTWSFGDSPGKASFDGSWTSGEGQRKLPFTLKESSVKGVPKLDFYFFAEEYSLKQGSQSMYHEQSLCLPQLRGSGATLDRVNGFIRSLAMLQLDASEEAPNADAGTPAPSLAALGKAVRANLPTADELNALEVGHFESLTFDEDFLVLLNAKEVFSMRMLHSKYTGGAHPNSSAAHVTFDLQSGEELTLDDLLNPGWRDALTELAEATLRDQFDLKKEDALNDKGPLFDNAFELNDNWFLSPEGLGFSFDPYEIGPYAAGFIEPIIPYSRLNGLVKPGSALERIIAN
jgi:hypothetical protein